MASYAPAKRATAWVGYISLVSQADTKLMKSNPTIASGDFKVSKDGGALANLTTLPSVTPASSVMVKIDLSATEMTADNVTVVCSDAAGAEWCDLVFNLQPSARQIDDLAYPATSGRSMVVDANGLVDANAVKVGPSGSGTAQTAKDIGAAVPAAAAGASGGLLISGSNSGTTTLGALTITGVTTMTGGLTAAITGNITGNLSGSVGSVTGAVGSVTGNVGGNVTGSVGSVAGAVGSVTGNVGGNVVGSVASVTANVNADVVKISGSTAAADNLEESTEAIVYGTAAALGSTTTVIASSTTPASTVDDQFNGRVLIFKSDTSTAALQGQATTISDYVHATKTFTVVALTTAPAAGDTFVIL